MSKLPQAEGPLAVRSRSLSGPSWRYTTERPGEDWTRPAFDDSSWKRGRGGFGTRGTPGIQVATEWKSSDIWLRGEIVIPEGKYGELQLSLYHDEDAEVFIDGNPAARVSGFTTEYEPVPVGRRASLAPGKRLFAIHCRQTTGGQGNDLGIIDLEMPR